MLQAACCLGFLDFYEQQNLVSSDEAFDSSAHLSLADIAIDSHSNPSQLQVHIIQSKTDPFCKGVHADIGQTSAM